jgi:adenylate cyclase
VKRTVELGFTILGKLTLSQLLIMMFASSWALSVIADGRLASLTSDHIWTIGLLAALLGSRAINRRRNKQERRLVGHRLAPAVVQRIFDQPAKRKGVGEQREITALFADIEGFCQTTRRADPIALITILDDYFEGMANIIVAHGGSIDKIVGDAVHVFFNASTDLEDHPKKAIECAIELSVWTREFRLRPKVTAIGFGRTRIGLETGPAIVRDVGIRAKLDYTAYGDAVNLAARLEQANKELGSSICIGPVAASRCDQSSLRPLGKINVQGRGDAIAVFEPWRRDTPDSWRECYVAAAGLYEQDPVNAADCFDRLAADQVEDPVPRMIASRMRAGNWQ